MSSTQPIAYHWTGHLLEASEEHQEREAYTLGGDTTLIHAEFRDRPDGSMEIRVQSNGPQTRQALSNLVNLLQSVVAQEAMEHHAEQAQKPRE